MVHSKINFATKRIFLRAKGVNAFYCTNIDNPRNQFSLTIYKSKNKDYIFLNDLRLYYFEDQPATLYLMDLF